MQRGPQIDHVSLFLTGGIEAVGAEKEQAEKGSGVVVFVEFF
jgi:hypothetical protein